jgi:hypothetical protein
LKARNKTRVSKPDRGVTQLLAQRRLVIEYLRVPGDPGTTGKTRGRPTGVVLVWKANDGTLKLGWAKHNPKDPYDRREGLRRALARGRRLVDVAGELETPWPGPGPTAEIKPVIESTIQRALRYFAGPPPAPAKRKRGRPKGSGKKPRKK